MAIRVKGRDGIFLYAGCSMRIIFDVFIFAGVIFFVSRKLVPIFRQHTAISQHCYCEIHCPDKLNFAT